MKSSLALLICLIAYSSTFLYPAVMAAQTTEISQVVSPKSIVAGSENPIPIATTVTYNAASGYQLIVGILDADLSPQVPVPGFVVSSTDPCVNQNEPAAFCVVTLQKQSGDEQVDFQIGGIFGGRQAPGKWDLNVTSQLRDQKGNLVSDSASSKLVTIELVPVALTVNAPPAVSLNIDGVQQQKGSVSIGVALGQHNITAPLLVQVDQTTRLRFSGWSDGYPSAFRDLVVTNATSLQVLYVTQYLLTIVGLQPNSTVTIWYDANTNATLSANQYQPATGLLGSLGVRLLFQGWYENGQLVTSSPTGTILMDKPHTLDAVWGVDYSVPAAIVVGIILLALAVFLVIRRTTTSHPRGRGQRRRKGQQ